MQSSSSDSASKGNDLDSLLNNSIPDENALRKRREEMQGYYQTAFHGSSHRFEKFDLGAIGTGLGAQAHGWGLYFAENKEVAAEYRRKLTKSSSPYTVVYDGKIDEKITNILSRSLSGPELYAMASGKKIDLQSSIARSIEAYSRDNKSIDKLISILQEQINKIEDNPKISITKFLKEVPSDEKDRFETLAKSATQEAKAAGRRANISDVLRRLREHIEPFIKSNDRNLQDIKLLESIDTSKVEVRFPGSVFEVDIPEKEVMLDEQKAFSEQSDFVKEKLVAISKVEENVNLAQAIANNATGRKLYKAVSSVGRKASETLNKYGIEGISYHGLKDGRCFVVFDDQAIKIINSYNQKVNNDKKGEITWDAEGKAIINLFEGADMSTVIHEAVGHYFIENLMREGALPNATEQMKKDRQTMLDYAGVNKDWDSLSQEEKTAAHERWAEAAETYMMEGKAPSKELQPVFNRFKKWLLAIYDAVFSDRRNKNAVPINDEVRQVFDRMLASEDQIAEMERIDGYFSALPDVVLDALSEPRKQMLRNFAAKAHDKAVQMLTKESLVNFNQERKDRIQKYREDVEPQVKEAIAKQPLYMASEQILDIASDLKTAKGVANRYLEGNFDESKMATFDMIAEANGFTSGDALAKTIMSEPSFTGAVNRHIDEMVQDAFPDIYKERGLAEEAARDAMYNDESGLLINTEAQLIEDKAQGLLKGQRDAETLRKLAVARRQTAKIQAQMDLQNRVKLKEALNTQKYITAERNAAAKAAVALENDDYSTAVRYKNVQAFNHACVVESVKLRNQYVKWQNYFRKQAKAKKETWGNERNFIQAAAIMERFGYKRKDYSGFEKTETLSEYLNDMDDLYDNVAVADWIMDEDVSITNPRERMTASQLEDVVNALKNIKAIAKQEMNINALQKGVTYAEFKVEAQETLNKLKTIWKPQVGVTQQPTVMEKLKASLRSTDNLFEMMDDWQYGFFSKHFGAAIREAADNETRKILEYEEKTAQAYREWLPDKAAEKAADYQKKYDELGTSVDQHVLVKMLMNLGNESSARVLCSTRPVGFENSALWVDGDIVQTKINLLDFLGRNLTEADIKYAQAKIDIAELYWFEMEALETRWTGFSPKKLKRLL